MTHAPVSHPADPAQLRGHRFSTRRRRGPRRLLGALAIVLGVLAAGCSNDEPQTPAAAPPPTDDTLPTTTTESAPEVDPFLQETAVPLTAGPISFYSEPDDGTEASHVLDNPRVINDDPDVTVPLVLLVREHRDGWLEVDLPVRPNGTTAWLPADAVQIQIHPYRIEVELGTFELRLFERDEVIFEADIAVAADNTPTPGGRYFTTELIAPPDPDGPYGTYAYGLSGFSEVLETFNGGPGQLGIHGTNQPELIGQSVSAGCIRMDNADIEHLADVIGLPLGVPVEIIADPGDGEAAGGPADATI